MSIQNKMSKSGCSQIIGIQFSILSPEEIRKGSVAEINSRDTYVNNKPVIGGLFDPRMGVLESGLICPTDGLDYMQTPGYFGHIELARPVFYIQYLSTILKVLKCVCFKCSKILISKTKEQKALKMAPEHRWKYIFALASKVKRCGEDTDDGCGCLQPQKIRKEGFATIIAEWKNDKNKEEGVDDEKSIAINLIPEIVLKIFKRISDEDVTFLGFSPIWSRPDWMICQVMAVPPPAVRPSVKHDAQQRSEDDLTHILVNIIKTNKTLQDKIQNNSLPKVIDDWTSVLQYYVATQVDNKIPGAAPVAQRSGRPLKSIKDRLNGKGGRMRGNLMAKRVDFSARSVITADPNISIRELGIPMKIAKNITKPIVVNDRNRDFLTTLVRNGPEKYPGAKILEKKNGDSITLRYVDISSIILENGDIVHRHMMDGDAVLFNRQPTLHRMSMMCHIARVMKTGDTFRMNVADTKPYNADFDGDEMNLHMPQDAESDSELFNLAAVPYQIISPSSNSPIIGIYQDSMLGSYRFTRDKVDFDPKTAMNLLMMFDRVNVEELRKPSISSFDILTQILPPLSMKVKNNQYSSETRDNNIIDIKDGKYTSGQIDKGILGSGSKGLIHRICNDFGNMASANFIDDLQNIVTEYMNMSSFSVGISDLISDSKTNDAIIQVIAEKKMLVKNLIDQTQIGIFENNSGKTNEEEFETQVNNILNKASAESGKIGLKSLSKDNRFVIMVNAGSKGSELNITYMISCLGQQNVDGKRIPYGFDGRTLPHFTKYDDSPAARGFVESSYINGLTPQELFFHAMGGRIGLIDTAVKTSTTGYIQRRLIKGLEDLMVNYDMTIRTNKNKIVQFSYGEDSIDTIKVENQELPVITMSLQDIYEHYSAVLDTPALSKIFTDGANRDMKREQDDLLDKCRIYTAEMIEMQRKLVTNVFKNKDEKIVRAPVSFNYIIANIIGQQQINENSLVDITPLYLFKRIETTFAQLNKIHYAKPTLLFKMLFNYYLSPKNLLYAKRFNRNALELLLDTIVLSYKRALVAPGEMVGLIAAQSIGEPTTQMTLNTFHFAGVASKSNVTRGVPRIEEILSLSPEPKNPSLTVYLKPDEETDKDKAQSIMYMLEHTKLEDIVEAVEICFDPDDLTTLIAADVETMEQYKQFEEMMGDCSKITEDKSKWIIRMSMDAEVMLEKNITMDDVNFTLKSIYNTDIQCIYSDYNADKLIFRIRMTNIVSGSKSKKGPSSLDQSDQIYILKAFQDKLLQNVVMRGIKGIDKVIMRKIKDKMNMVETLGTYQKQQIWVLDTIGTNLIDVLALDYIDPIRTISNDIVEMCDVLGIEAARQCIYNEITDVIEFDGTYINYHHLSVLCDRMTFTHKMISMFRHGINNDNIGPIAKASFEETPEMFLKAARHGDLDIMKGVSANVMCAQEGFYGTSAFQVVLNIEEMIANGNIIDSEKSAIEKTFDTEFGIVDEGDCSVANLTMQNNVLNIKYVELGNDDDYDPFL